MVPSPLLSPPPEGAPTQMAPFAAVPLVTLTGEDQPAGRRRRRHFL